MTAGEVAAAAVAHTGWRYCTKCRGLFFSPRNDTLGACPDGGKHKPRKDASCVLYVLPPGSSLWSYWFRCTKCAVLYLTGAGDALSLGVCPKGARTLPTRAPPQLPV